MDRKNVKSDIAWVLDGDNPSDREERKSLDVPVLEKLTEYLINSENREKLPEVVLTRLADVLRTAAVCSSGDKEMSSDSIELCCQSYRCLRNACAQCRKNQLQCRKEDLLDITETLFRCCFTQHVNTATASAEPAQKVVVLLRCAVQFLGNACVGCEDNKTLVWDKFFHHFKRLLLLGDQKLCSHTCMIIHTCLTPGQSQRHSQLMDTQGGLDLTHTIIQILSTQDCEWGLYIMQQLLSHPLLFDKIYKMLNQTEQNLLLDIMAQRIEEKHSVVSTNPEEGQSSGWPAVENLQYLATNFQTSVDQIIDLSGLSTPDQIAADMMLKWLRLLCRATAVPGSYLPLRQHSAALSSTVKLLHSLRHVVPRNASKETSSEAPSDRENALFGLKKYLIQFIGNMVHKNTGNQNQVRELGGIPLILDNTSIDDNNPYITQWSIFAIHNLLENNPANQAVVEETKKQGTVREPWLPPVH